MSTSNERNESSCEGENISSKEIRILDDIASFSLFLDVDLIAISNRIFCYETVHREFFQFSSYITSPFNYNKFKDFLTPVFVHLYFLLFSYEDKSSADRFLSCFEHLPIPSFLIFTLKECKTLKEVDELINSQSKISVKVCRSSYAILLNWLMESFTTSSKMFIILRVLHENINLEVFVFSDPEDDPYLLDGIMISEVESWFTSLSLEGLKEKEFDSIVTNGTSAISKKDENLAEKESDSIATDETSKISKEDATRSEDLVKNKSASQTTAGTYSTSDIYGTRAVDILRDLSDFQATIASCGTLENYGSRLKEIKKEVCELQTTIESTNISENNDIEVTVDLISLLFSTKYPVKNSETLEEQKKFEPETTAVIRRMPLKNENKPKFEFEASMFEIEDSARRYFNQVKNSGSSMEEMRQALFNLPDPPFGDFPEEFPFTTEKDKQKKNVNESSELVAYQVSEESVEKYFLEYPRSLATESADDQKMDISEDGSSVAALSVDSSSLDQATVSSGDSEYLICSEASIEKSDEDENQAQENVDDQDLNYAKNGENNTHAQENVECANQDMDVLSGNEENDVLAQKNDECIDKDVGIVTGNKEGDTQEKENVECADEDMNEVTGNKESDTQEQENVDCADEDMNEEGTENDPGLDDLIDNDVMFKNAYKSSFHATYLITISGKDMVCSSDISSDLLYMAIGFESCKICTWRLGESQLSFKQIGTLKGHTGIVYAVSIDSKRKSLVSGSHDCTVRVWDMEENCCNRVIEAHFGPVYDVCVSPNSMYFVSTSEDRQICLFWYDDVSPFQIYYGHSLQVSNRVRFHPNSAYFACACFDGTLFLFNINVDCRPVRFYCKHLAKVYTLAFSPCGNFLASADLEGIIVIWNILTSEILKIFETGQPIRSISYDMCGSFLAVLFYYKTWKLYSIETDRHEAVVEATSVGVPKAASFCADNKMFLIQYVESTKEEILEMKGKPKTTLTVVR